MRSYLLAASPRTGGNWLCRRLTECHLGAPGEHLNWTLEELDPDPPHAIRERDWTRDELHALWDAHATDGIYGVKAHLTAPVARLDLDDILPPGPRGFIWLTRRDRDAQVRSYARAREHGSWFASAPVGACVDPDEVEAARAELDDMHDAWAKWFAHHGIEPLRVTYETMVAAMPGVVGGIAYHLEKCWRQP